MASQCIFCILELIFNNFKGRKWDQSAPKEFDVSHH